MAQTPGLGISEELTNAFSGAITSKNVRFLKISIRNELLVPDGIIPPIGTFENDLNKLQELLEDNVPAYVLVRLDEPSSDWIAVHYVPDTVTVKEKMLYALFRNSLTKSLGSTYFTDTVFATSKSDVSPEGYAAHKRHVAAPNPMSAQEKEMADVRAAERQAGSGAYEGSRARHSPLGTGVGLNWSPEVEDSIKDLASGSGDRLVVLTIDTASETLVLSTVAECSADDLSTKIPSSEPAFAFFAWSRDSPYRQIIFIYSCPSSSPVKHRMLYSGSSNVYQTAKQLLPGANLAPRKVETSDPSELNAAFLQAEVDHSGDTSRSGTTGVAPEEKQAFARPRGPAKRR